MHNDQASAGRKQPGLDLITQGQQGLAGVQGLERYTTVLLAPGSEGQQLIVEFAKTATARIV